MSKTRTLVLFKNALFKPLDLKFGLQWVFEKPINDFQIKSNEKWAVIGSQKTEFLKVLNNEYLAEPVLLRKFPFLASLKEWPLSSIAFLNFNKNTLPKVHLSARYEFFKEDLDETVYNFVTHHLVNANKQAIDMARVDRVLRLLELTSLKDNWLMGLSNGQLRRARFARALVKKPNLLLVDDPFLGLDPVATQKISNILGRLGTRDNSVSDNKEPHIEEPYVIIGLRLQDPIPDWVTHIAIVDKTGVTKSGLKTALLEDVKILKEEEDKEALVHKASVTSEIINNIWKNKKNSFANTTAFHIQFNNVSISYRGKQIIKNFSLDIKRGEKWHVRGNSGTGKTTLLSLVMADHPQSWNSGIIINGVPRKTGKQNYFDINKDISFSSPELHAIFPTNLTVRQALLTGSNIGSNFIVPKNGITQDTYENIDFLMREFGLVEKQDTKFGDLSISDQKVVLFARAILKAPDILILDEALSCMDEEMIVVCKGILRKWPGTVLAIAHVENEVPECDHFVKLLGPGEYEEGTI